MVARIVGIALVRNEDRFVEQAIRNVARFCDVIHVVDHVSDDRTWEIVRTLASEFDHVDARRSRNSAVAHRLLEQYAGTPTWVLGVDGDELYDPSGLARLRVELRRGVLADVFRVKAHVLNCDELNRRSGVAAGWFAPPSRPVTKLFNFGAVKSWTGSPDPLQSGDIGFETGFSWESRRNLADETDWESDPLRLLHVCFLRRSSRESDDGIVRSNLDESRAYDRSPVGTIKRALRRPRRSPQLDELQRRGRSWKHEWYARGERAAVDATPFFDV